MRDGAMPQQGSFSQAEYASKKKRTRRDKPAPAQAGVSGRDGAGYAVASAGGASFPALPERRARSATNSLGANAADSLFAAMVRAGRPSGGRSAIRQPGDAGLCRD